MEFDEDFALLQGTLISLEKNVGELKVLSLCKDEEKIRNVIDSMKMITDKGIKTNEKSVNSIQTLRRLLMFLVLNTDLNVKEQLVDDVNCGHIVDCAPVLSKELLVELIDKLLLRDTMCEAIMYVPLSLGVELLDSALTRLDSMPPFQILAWVENLARSVYTKYMILQSSKKGSTKSVQSKLFTYFKNLIQHFTNPSQKNFSKLGKEELYRYAGFALKSLLSLIIHCGGLHLNPGFLETPEVFTISLPEYNQTTEMETVSSTKFIAELLYACKTNCQSITVDIWSFWVECDIEVDGDVTKSLQRIIAEAMYGVSQLLVQLHDIKAQVSAAEDIIEMFANMAVKPRDEDDEIKEADIDLIMENVLDHTRSRKKWFKAMIDHDIMTNEDCIECLEKCLSLADYEDAKVVIEKSIKVLDSNSSDANQSRIKDIGLEVIKHLPLDQQIDFVRWYFEKFGINTKLIKENFQATMTEVFNKAVKTSDREKFVSECVPLCLQSPVDFIKKVMHEALMNNKQISLMVNVLKHFKWICNVHASEEEELPLTLVTDLLDKKINENLTDAERSNLPKFVTCMINHDIMDGSEFLRYCLLPALHKSVCYRNWSDVLLWLQTLKVFVNGLVKVDVDVSYSPVLVMLAQVLENGRWNVATFSAIRPSVCEEAIGIVRLMLDAFVDKKTEVDIEVKWLWIKLDCVSSQNKSYFSKLWHKFGKDCTSSPYSVDLFLLDMIQSGSFIEENNVKVTNLLEKVKSKTNSLLFSLSKILPLCTVEEWKSLADSLIQMKMISSVHLFLDSVLLFTEILQKKMFLNNSMLSCLEYCIRNLSIIMKEKLIAEVTRPDEKVKVFIKLLHILGKLPPTCRESCSILVVNVLVILMEDMFDDEIKSEEKMHHIRDMATSLGVLNNSELMQIVARKMIDCLDLESI